ncbi:MAG TPA: amino acid ABC transporter substrate-binding protein [Xanthomonadales bacterium]|nr:amino acid ABC transporter substrate-binding protein [Xanthomonadales bacterium]
MKHNSLNRLLQDRLSLLLATLALAIYGISPAWSQDEAEADAAEAAEPALVAAPAPTTVLERLASGSTLKVGYRSDAQPFSYKDSDGKPAGYTVELCGKVISGLGSNFRTEWVETSLEGGLDAVANGSIDLLCGATSVTLSRREHVSFSIPVFPSGIGALIRSDAPDRLRLVLQGQAAPNQPLWRGSPATVLQHRNFSALAGSHAEQWLGERINTFKLLATVAPVDSYEAGIERVLSRQSDVLFGDRAILSDAAQNSASGSELLVLDRLFTVEPIALAVPRGDEDFRLSVDRALSGMYESAEFADLFTSHFGEPNERVLLFFRSITLPE